MHRLGHGKAFMHAVVAARRARSRAVLLQVCCQAGRSPLVHRLLWGTRMFYLAHEDRERGFWLRKLHSKGFEGLSPVLTSPVLAEAGRV